MKDENLYLVHMLECVHAILNYTDGVAMDELHKAGMLQDAVLHNLQLIGENVKHISDDTLARMPDQPWHKIKGLRNMIVHEYIGINMDVIVNVVEQHLESLCHDLEKVVSNVMKR